MKRQFIKTLSLIVAISGVSPVMAADAGMASGHTLMHPENTRPITLSNEHMDQVKAGRTMYEVCSGGVCAGYDTERGYYYGYTNLKPGSSFTDAYGRTVTTY